MMPRRPIHPGASPKGCCCLPHPTERRLLLRMMRPYTPFSKTSHHQDGCRPVVLVQGDHLVLNFPMYPPTQRGHAPITRGHPHLRPLTPARLLIAPALQRRGHQPERPSLTRIPPLNTARTTHSPKRTRVPHRI
ncbi:hypothetical protein BJV78DRAFT_82179 [Lactifluus subvellereus]|nr:hypothetical protein BJV78DRAFT_82179 [Lactifluus subvellereus]